MREIEIKARIDDMSQLLERLASRGVILSEPLTQRDQVFGVPGIEGNDTNREAWLRIRTEEYGENVKHIFTLKRSVTSQLDCIEHETAVADPVEMRAIILELGYEPYVDITKTRRRAKLGEIEICVDTVDQLGEFIEAEKLSADDVNQDEIYDELWKTLEKYGISRSDKVTDGYDVLMRRR